ncbi:MAG: hypothetical protein IJW59_05730 [Clostridia bacterium]|nr:hypothetical protein [Clostridia bacterium]
MKNKRKSRFFQLITIFILCCVCVFTFAGCLNTGGGYTASPPKPPSSPSTPDSGGGSSGGSGSTLPGVDTTKTYKDINDVVMGAIGVYDIGAGEEAFYDKYLDKNVSFETLVNRQFNALAKTIYNYLYVIYGKRAETQSYDYYEIDGFGDTPRTVILDNLNFRQGIKNHEKLSGLDGNNTTFTYSELLSFDNAIEGGYELTTTTTLVNGTDENNNPISFNQYASASYSTTTLVEGNAWVGKDRFTAIGIKNALIHIYQNMQIVDEDMYSDEADVFIDSDSDLASYYKNDDNFKTISATTETSTADITEIGFSREYLWNVVYYLAYSIIGEKNIDNSIDSYNAIFDRTSANDDIIDLSSIDFTDALKQKFQNYKGYNIVLKEVVRSAFNLVVDNEGVSFSSDDYFTGAHWETTLFPSLKRERYIFYDTVEYLCDANNPDVFPPEEDDSSDEEDEDAYEKFESGSLLALKKIILLPLIDTSKFQGAEFDINGVAISFQTQTGEKYQVEISTNAIYNDATSTDKVGTFEVDETMKCVKDNKLQIDDEFFLSDDLGDLNFNLEGKFSTAVNKQGNNISKSMITDSFSDKEYEIHNRTLKIGVLNVYNQFFADGGINVSSSLLEIDFTYFDASGNKLTTAPNTYLMYFQIY